ncbi:MAG: ribonuclease HII [Candidatus Staskawiczbacteria bacterium]|nr:ribonuclease HII [Candidatus Staskawiczbacteria bacterium]
MQYPNFNEEKKLKGQGFKCVVGLDEAGRGPLAGPVVAAAVIISNFEFRISKLKIRDSKQMSKKQREKVYEELTSCPEIHWGVGIVSEKVIDKINILEATKLAMKKAIKNLKPDYLLLDGNFKIKIDLPQRSIIKGDQKVISISAASIIAKVTRDKIMQKYHKKYPNYGFDQHKGYGTKAHIEKLRKFGACPIHRKSFSPVSLFY